MDGLDWDLSGLGWDDKELNKLIHTGESEGDDLYSSKIEAPIYTITGEKPGIDDLYNTEKTKNLISRIDSLKITDIDLKTFLTAAAYRHTIFSFDKIAEFYAHATKEIQELMEESALIIIDFEKAIENGFVKMSKDIAENYLKDEAL